MTPEQQFAEEELELAESSEPVTLGELWDEEE